MILAEYPGLLFFCSSSRNHQADKYCLLCAAAEVESITSNDPLDQRFVEILAPTLAPVFTYISRTPAISDALVQVLGNQTPLVSCTKPR